MDEVFVPASIPIKTQTKYENMYNDKKDEIIKEIIELLKSRDNNINNNIINIINIS
jgi:hypothetical protein